MSGLMIILTAPSGTGKTTLADRVLDQENALAFSVSHTTRPPRGAETDGVEYHFVDDATFDQMVEQDGFAEWAHVHKRRYGTSHGEVQRLWDLGHEILFDIDPQGGVQLMAAYPEAISIFLVPPSIEALESRLRRRGTDSEEQVLARLGVARDEIGYASRYDYVITNDDLEVAVADFRAVLRAERLKSARQDRGLARLMAHETGEER